MKKCCNLNVLTTEAPNSSCFSGYYFALFPLPSSASVVFRFKLQHYDTQVS